MVGTERGKRKVPASNPFSREPASALKTWAIRAGWAEVIDSKLGVLAHM